MIDRDRIVRNVPLTSVLPADALAGTCPFCGANRLIIDAAAGFFDCPDCFEFGDVIIAFAGVHDVDYATAARRLHEKAVSIEHMAEQSKH